MNEHQAIAEEVRSYARTLPIGYVHIEIAVETALRTNDAHAGIEVADRIAEKLVPIRRRFSIAPNYRET